MSELPSTDMRPTKRRRLDDTGVIIDHDPQKINRSSSPEGNPTAIEITKDYALRLDDLFASGAYANIHKATMIRPGGSDRCQVAVKVLRYTGMKGSPQQQEQIDRINKRLSREMEVWKRLIHPRITPLLAYAKSSSEILPGGGPMLISPYRKNDNLRAYLSANPKADKVLLLQQICEGINYIHNFEPPIAHLDLKPENVLINDREEAELCDFGLAKALEDACTGFTTSTVGTGGTLVYMAPETLNGELQTTASDIYSMGGVILDVMSGVPPWGQTPRGKITVMIAQGRTPPPKQHAISVYSPSLVNAVWLLMQRCWSFDPVDRPTALEVLNALVELNKLDTIAEANLTASGNTFTLPHREAIVSNVPKFEIPFPVRNDPLGGSANIENYREALDLCPPGDPLRLSSLQNLAMAICARYDQNTNSDDLSASIELYEEAVKICPFGHPQRAMLLHDLARALDVRYQLDKGLDDLSATIEYFQEAVEIHPPGHPRRLRSLHFLAHNLMVRHIEDSNPDDFHNAIKYHQEIADLLPPGHPERGLTQHNLARVLNLRYEQDGDPVDLYAAIEHFQEAVKLLPPGHPERLRSLEELAQDLMARYILDNNPNDLDDAIEHYQEIIHLPPLGHPKRDEILHDLAYSFSERFEQRNDPEDLSNAIKYYREALDLRPPQHPDRLFSLHNLAFKLKDRYNLYKNPDDLRSAIEHYTELVNYEAPLRLIRNVVQPHLAQALEARYEQYKDPVDLYTAIEYHQDMVDHHPPGNSKRFSLLYDLAHALKSLYELNRNPNDLSAAIKHFEEAIDLWSPYDPRRTTALQNLEDALKARREITEGRC